MSMRVPFPLNISVGTDIIAHHRLTGQHVSFIHLQRLASRFLHPNEVSDLNKRFPDWKTINEATTAQRTKIGTYLAGRWAAKEAAKKAWGATLISFKDLRVETVSGGEVQIICQSYHDTKLSTTKLRTEGSLYEQAAKLSISHDGDYAVATVIATSLHPEILADLQARKAKADQKVAATKNQP